MKKYRVYFPKEEIGGQLSYLDGTKYIRMPNGQMTRVSPRAYQIRKNNKNSLK